MSTQHPTYAELRAQAEKLLAQAEEARQREMDEAIAEIKGKINLYGLTAQDLGFQIGRSFMAKKAKAPSPVKYRGPKGETWSGARGRKPNWVLEALKEGKKLEDFEVTH